MTTKLNEIVLSGTVGTVSCILKSENYSVESNLFTMTSPGGNETETIVEDFEGVSGSIKLDGEGVGKTLADLKTWEASIRALQTGMQTGYTYSSDKYGDLTVYVESANTTWNSDTEQAVSFSITLTIGA